MSTKDDIMGLHKISKALFENLRAASANEGWMLYIGSAIADAYQLGKSAADRADEQRDIVQPPSPPEHEERLAPPLPYADALMAEAGRNVKGGVDPTSLVPSGRQFLQDAQGTGNPFDGFTFEPWDDGKLHVMSADGDAWLVGLVSGALWHAWLPLGEKPLASGREAADPQRAVEKALIEASARIPWHKP